jgi:nucleotide-binding universal stress UspA family protein
MAKPRIENGTDLDGFIVGKIIHKGGMAMLYEASKAGIDVPLLLKVPLLFEGEDPAAIVSFEMEQMILPRLSGPHVPACFGIGDFAAQPYIAMERIGGSALPEPRGRMKEEDVAALGHKIACALESIHRQHVVHHDIKPANIMFRPSGDCVLIDFGLAHSSLLPDLMAEEFRLPYGTAPYMAPEQILGIRGDKRSDLFALGVLLYYFLTGKEPFGDPERMSGLKRRLWRDPVPPRALVPACPAWLQEVILRCLEVMPANRYSTAAQLAFDLKHPDQVKLTERATRLHRDPWLTVLRRRFDSGLLKARMLAEYRNDPAPTAIILVAIDLVETNARLSELLRLTARRVLDNAPGARLACLNVLKRSRVTIDRATGEDGENVHVHRLVELKHWAAPLKLGDTAVTFHVLEAPDAAAAILDFAVANNVDHIVMGARARSTLRSLLGATSAEVAANAPCTVTVVRERSIQAAPFPTA